MANIDQALNTANNTLNKVLAQLRTLPEKRDLEKELRTWKPKLGQNILNSGLPRFEPATDSFIRQYGDPVAIGSLFPQIGKFTGFIDLATSKGDKIVSALGRDDYSSYGTDIRNALKHAYITYRPHAIRSDSLRYLDIAQSCANGEITPFDAERALTSLYNDGRVDEYIHKAIIGYINSLVNTDLLNSHYAGRLTEASGGVNEPLKDFNAGFSSLAASTVMEDFTTELAEDCQRCCQCLDWTTDEVARLGEELAKLNSNSVLEGIIAGLDSYAKQTDNLAKSIENCVVTTFNNLENALVDFVNTGKLEFTSLVDSMIRDIIRLTIRSSITGPLAAGLSAGISSLFSQSSSVLDMSNLFDNPSLTSQGSALIPPIYRSARGNAFTKGSGLQSYRNSVVSSPTYFAFARGGIPRIGLMGEKPGSPGEAILPLTRTSSGNLGVEAVTGGGGASPQVNITVNNSMANEAEVQVRQTPSANGGMDLELMVKRIYRSDVARGGIDGHLRSGGWKQRPVGH